MKTETSGNYVKSSTWVKQKHDLTYMKHEA